MPAMSFRNALLRLQEAYRRRVARAFFRRPFTICPQQPLISFTFDDFPRSALFGGGAILTRFGLAATYYASLGLMGKEAPTGQIFVGDDLRVLYEQGHELGCHTYSHCDSWDTKTAVFESSVIENQAALEALLPGAAFNSFSYPISLPRPLTKARIARHFLSCRVGGQTLNAGNVDLNQLSAYFLEKSRDNIEAIKDLIDHNRKVHGWLIFATHDISDNPTPFGCTPKFFEQVVQYAVSSGARVLPVVGALEVLGVPGCRQESVRPRMVVPPNANVAKVAAPSPLVSILIPAYNAQEWISDTLRSAIAQTWERKEIIVVDDGSTDQTLAIAQQFESDCVRVVTQKNQGAAASRNHALSLSRGDYIQWLDADDLLAPDKISGQMAVLERDGNKRILLSSSFGRFLYRWRHAEFIPSGLWNDLSPSEWLLRKMGDNLYMQTATWLVSRELSEEAGGWDTRMLSDDDGEYFCRVLLKSDGVRFVPECKVYYRGFGYDGLAYVGASIKKREALWLSMQMHIGYLRSLRDDQETRVASRAYLQRNLVHFYPDMPDIVKQAGDLASALGGKLDPPHLAPKYFLIRAIFGWHAAKNLAISLRKVRWSAAKWFDRALFSIQYWRDSEPSDSREAAPVFKESAGANAPFVPRAPELARYKKPR
jgi:glycosyltransferase involved in cell wall biosynthesis/peptidoglycan/xylan/chitin deacetylase (PgdA/CDA1 family)